MPFIFHHPSLVRLTALLDNELSVAERASIASHVQECVRCQRSLRHIQRLNAPAHEALPDAPAGLLQRIQASRAAGERVILPAAASSASGDASRTLGRTAWRVNSLWKVAATLIIVFGATRLFTPSTARAAGDHSTLTLFPKLPTANSEVRVRYTPVSGTFRAETLLRVRARVRMPDNESYTVPAGNLRILGTLSRQKDGTFTGRFRVPDSVVFATLAVEDSTATVVDDNVEQGWDLLVSGRDGRPLFAALMQRSNDMMGRSWEQAYASTRQATALYPDSVSGWTTRQFFEGELFTGAQRDSVRAVRDVTINALVARAKRAPSLSYADIEGIYFRAYVAANARGATPSTRADSVEWDYWWTRIQREYPTHEQISQRLAVWMDMKRISTADALDSLEHLYARNGIGRGGAGRNLIHRGIELATTSGDVATMRRWTERLYSGAVDSTLRMAVWLSGKPATRDAGMPMLRGLLSDGMLNAVVLRPLGRNATAQRRAVESARRTVLAALGRALVAQGNASAGLDTLRLAATGGWNPSLYRELVRSYALAGDSAGVLEMRARLAVDGRTTTTARDSLHQLGVQRVGLAAWERAVAGARAEMHARLLERSTSRGIASTARVRARDGTAHSLASLTRNSAALVIFWSRNCGYAIDAVPGIRSLIANLHGKGTPVVFVAAEAPSAELDAALSTLGVTWPVYYDVGTSLGDAMRNFGTPHYYVIDNATRIRFSGVDELEDLYGQLEAVARVR